MRGDASSTLILGTRGLRARHRHLLRDLLRLMPHGKAGTKLDVENGLKAVVRMCEDADCGAALLFDARDVRRLYMWVACCPDGPSAMFRVLNVHTVSELKFDARRISGVRSLLSFDKAFESCADRRVMKALLTRAFGVPRQAAVRLQLDDTKRSVERIKHTLNFSYVDHHIWLRVYRIGRSVEGKLDIEEIGPRLVLEPVRIIASGFGGAVLHSQESTVRDEWMGERDEEPMT
jgi:ribosome biogenesis protein BRX1